MNTTDRLLRLLIALAFAAAFGSVPAVRFVWLAMGQRLRGFRR